LSELILNCESFNKILDGRKISIKEYYQVFKISKENPDELFKTANILQNKNHGKVVTFSKKAFFNLVNLCRDTCTYCTYKAEPGESKLSLMSKEDVQNLSELSIT